MFARQTVGHKSSMKSNQILTCKVSLGIQIKRLRFLRDIFKFAVYRISIGFCKAT